jgi:hypothetical protein
VPLLFALRWIAAKFPMSCYATSTEVHYLEPGKLALFCEHYDERHHYNFVRVFVLDFEKKTLNELRCPPKAGVMWSSLEGVDIHGNAVCRVDSKPDEYYSCSPQTGESLEITKTNACEFIGRRYLCTPGNHSGDASFTWQDLAEKGYPAHKQTLNSAAHHLVAIPMSNAFYYIAYDSSDPQVEMISKEQETEAELNAIDMSNTIPASIDPNETLVLMQMSEVGPIEIARWLVVGGSGYVTYQVGDGCIGCVSLDRKTINIHDAKTGAIRFQIPVPPTALGSGNRPDSWSMFDSFISLRDGLGATLVYNTTTGDTLDVSASWNRRLLGHHDEEYLTLALQKYPDDWPGNLEIRNKSNGELLNSWPIPEREVIVGSPTVENTKFSPDGREIHFITADGRVLFAEKASGKIIRTIQPRFWIPYISIFVCLATLAWLIYWIRYSVRVGATYWLDEGVVLGIVSLFLYWRIMLSGCYEDYGRLAWHCAAACLMAFGALIIHRTVNSTQSFSLRSLPIAIFLSILFIGMHSILDRGWYFNSTLTRTLILGCVLTLGFIVANWFFRSNQNSNAVETRQRSYRLTLRQLLLLTIYCALAMAALRWMDLRICFDVMKREGVGIAIYGFLPLIAYYFTYRRGLIWLKSLLVGAIALGIFLGWVSHEDWWAPDLLHVVARWAASVAQITLATILMALPILMRRKDLPRQPHSKNEELPCV